MDTLRVKTEWDGQVLIARVLCESITNFDTAPLESELKTAGQQSLWRLALDLSAVQLMGSCGLGLLLTIRKEATASKGRVVLFGVNPEIMGTLKVTKLDTLLTIAKDRKAAVASLT